MPESVFSRARERAGRRRRRYALVAGSVLAGVLALVFGLTQRDTGRERSRADATPVSQQHRETPRNVALQQQRLALRARSEAARQAHEAALQQQEIALRLQRAAARQAQEAMRLALLARQRHP